MMKASHAYGLTSGMHKHWWGCELVHFEGNFESCILVIGEYTKTTWINKDVYTLEFAIRMFLEKFIHAWPVKVYCLNKLWYIQISGQMRQETLDMGAQLAIVILLVCFSATSEYTKCHDWMDYNEVWKLKAKSHRGISSLLLSMNEADCSLFLILSCHSNLRIMST